MITNASVQLAASNDAEEIAALSRDYIEQGLGWSWNSARVRRAIRDPDINVAVVRSNAGILAFGIMSYRGEVALARRGGPGRGYHAHRSRVPAPEHRGAQLLR